jgi:hypothetical protein
MSDTLTLDQLEQIARAGSPGPFQAVFSYREPATVLALIALSRRSSTGLVRIPVSHAVAEHWKAIDHA